MHQLRSQIVTVTLLSAYALLVVITPFTPGLSLTAVAGGQRSLLRQNLTALTVDDAFYYLHIADHIAAGHGATFDGIHTTNGYHPLWLWLLVPIFSLTADKEVALVIVTGVQILFFAAGVVLTYLIAKSVLRRAAAIMTALLWVYLQTAYWMPVSGMEYGLQTVLQLLAMWVYVCRIHGQRPLSKKSYLLLGVILSLTFLARLDTLLLAATLGGALLWLTIRGDSSQRHWQPLLMFGLPIAGTVALYLWWNLQQFGQPLPLSGAIKLRSSTALLAHDPLFQEKGWLVAKAAYLLWPFTHQRKLQSVSLLIGTVGCGFLFASRYLPLFSRGPERQAALRTKIAPFTPFISFSILHLAVYVVLYHGGLSFQPWYYVMPIWLTALFWGIIVETGRARWAAHPGRKWGMIGAVTLLLLFTAAAVRSARSQTARYGETEVLYQGPVWAMQHLPENAIIGAWNAGMLGFFSGRQVVNLDGLVNSWAFERVDRHDLCQYWRKNDIAYLVDIFDTSMSPRIIPPYYAPETAVAACADGLVHLWTGPNYAETDRHIQAYQITHPETLPEAIER